MVVVVCSGSSGSIADKIVVVVVTMIVRVIRIC